MAKHLIKIYCCVFSLIFICAFDGKAAAFDEKDSAAIFQTLGNFYAAYRTKDRNEWKKLWHDNSPTVAGREVSFDGWTLTAEPEKLASLTIEKGWDKTFATAEIVFTGDAPAHRHAGLIKDGNTWKIWHESSLEAFLAAQKLAAEVQGDLPGRTVVPAITAMITGGLVGGGLALGGSNAIQATLAGFVAALGSSLVFKFSSSASRTRRRGRSSSSSCATSRCWAPWPSTASRRRTGPESA